MTTPNKIVHFEIPADQPARAKTFYEKSFGWKIEAYPGFADYWGVGTTPVNDKREPSEPGINGGMAKREGALMHPVLTIDVPNLERALATIEKNGGKVVQGKQPVGDIGFTAYFKDSEGNVMGLYQKV